MTETTTARRPAGPSARERLLAAADELFYAEGVQTVGIDRIIDRAGVAKASLYNTFGSKEELVHAYLTERHRRIQRRLEAAMTEHDNPRDQLLAIFDSQARFVRSGTAHGCAFARASAEAPAGGRVAEAAAAYWTWVLGLMSRLADEAGADDPDTVATQLLLLYQGVYAALQFSSEAATDAGVKAAASLIDAAIARKVDTSTR